MKPDDDLYFWIAYFLVENVSFKMKRIDQIIYNFPYLAVQDNEKLIIG